MAANWAFKIFNRKKFLPESKKQHFFLAGFSERG